MDGRTRVRFGIALAGTALLSVPVLSGPAGVGPAGADTMGTTATTTAEPAPTTTMPPATTTTLPAPTTTPTTPPTTAPMVTPTTPTTAPTAAPTTTTTAAPNPTNGAAPTTTTTTAPETTQASEPDVGATVAPASMERYLGPLAAAAAGTTFSNATKITIPEPGFVPPPWPGLPHPSAIPVSGLTGTVTDVNVVLPKLDCARDPRSGEAWPEDFDLLLVGPTGANLVILSDVGGDDNVSHPAPNLSITLDDAASQPLPINTQLASGTFKPTDDDSDRAYESDSSDVRGGPGRDLFPAPAPAPSTSTILGVFNGTDPNGSWQLFASDDRAGFDRCELTNGWSLEITTAQPTGGAGTGGSTTTTGEAGNIGRDGAATAAATAASGASASPTDGSAGRGASTGATTSQQATAAAAAAAAAGNAAVAAGRTTGTRAAVAGTSTTRSTGTTPLARTGAPLSQLIRAGLGLVLAGVVLVRRSRRRPPSGEPRPAAATI